jgi:hypothetical protein
MLHVVSEKECFVIDKATSFDAAEVCNTLEAGLEHNVENVVAKFCSGVSGNKNEV